jgi:DNA-binding NarL/FixJ family response regulator
LSTNIGAAPILVRVFAHHPVALREYTQVLAADEDMRVVSGDAAFSVGVFDGDAVENQRSVALAHAKAPSMRAVLVSEICSSDESLRWILKGFWGLVPYSRYQQDLARAVRQVAAGQLWFPPQAVIRWMQSNDVRRVGSSIPGLTWREREVTDLLERRLSNKEIACVLRISERTVKFHVGNVLAKLRVHSRRELTKVWTSVRSA